ncbi:unnamed protein product, partial [Musa textilis]
DTTHQHWRGQRCHLFHLSVRWPQQREEISGSSSSSQPYKSGGDGVFSCRAACWLHAPERWVVQGGEAGHVHGLHVFFHQRRLCLFFMCPSSPPCTANLISP